MALCLGPLHVRITGARPVQLADQRLWLEPDLDAARVVVQVMNESTTVRKVQLRLGRASGWQTRALAPGEVWRTLAPR